MMHSFGYSALVLTSSHPGKMRLKCKELFHRKIAPPHDVKKNAALIREGHHRRYQSLHC